MLEPSYVWPCHWWKQPFHERFFGLSGAIVHGLTLVRVIRSMKEKKRKEKTFREGERRKYNEEENGSGSDREKKRKKSESRNARHKKKLNKKKEKKRKEWKERKKKNGVTGSHDHSCQDFLRHVRTSRGNGAARRRTRVYFCPFHHLSESVLGSMTEGCSFVEDVIDRRCWTTTCWAMLKTAFSMADAIFVFRNERIQVWTSWSVEEDRRRHISGRVAVVGRRRRHSCGKRHIQPLIWAERREKRII